MARANVGGSLVLGGLVGLAAWYLWTRKPLVVSKIITAAEQVVGIPSQDAAPTCVSKSVTPALPDIVLPDGTVIPGGPQPTVTCNG